MSEVVNMNKEETAVTNTDHQHGDADGEANNDAHGPIKIIAPQLRVEVLREDGHSSAASVSDLDETLSDRDEPDRSPPAEKPFVPPTDELKDKIKKQVEFYFSDANILKDAFLLKHAKRNKQGFVSLKLITSFRKVKSLTKDFRVTAYSLRESEELEVSDDGTKIKRKKPLPDYDETTPSRTIIAMNLPKQNLTIEEVSAIFSVCGEISLIRVLKPGKSIPPDVKRHMNKHPELDNTTCAVVEFEHHESAKKACETLTDDSDWRSGMSVKLLAHPPKKDNHHKKNDAKNKQHKNSGGEAETKTINHQDDATVNSGSSGHKPEDSGGHGVDKRKSSAGNRKKGNFNHGENHHDTGSDGEGSGGNWRQDNRTYPRDSLSPQGHHYSPGASPRGSPRSSPRGSPISRRRKPSHGKSPLATADTLSTSPKLGSPCQSPETRRKQNSSLEASPSPSGSPWVQRRLKAMEGTASPLVGSPIGSPRLGRRLLDLEGVTRQPKGPEGNPGFYGGKGRGAPIVNQS